MRLAAVALSVVLGLAGTAEARQHHPARGHRIVPGASAPTDALSANLSGAYGFRRLRTAWGAAVVVTLKRASDGLTQGITAETGDFDVASASTFCAATTCTVQQVNDQSGLGRHLTQATAANQPAYVADCVNTKPCMRFTAATQTLVMAVNVTPATGVVSMSAVGNRSVGTGPCHWLKQNSATAGNRLLANAANQWLQHNGTTSLAVTTPDAAWHTAVGVYNGAGSFYNIDGVQTAGTLAGSVTAGPPSVTGGATVTCDWVEGLIWDNRALGADEVVALQANQRGYLGP